MKDNKSANARVFVLVDDYEPTNTDLHPPKTLYQLTSFINVSSDGSVDGNGGIGGGNCSVTFNDLDFRFFREYPLDKLNGKDFGNSNVQFDEDEELSQIKLSYPEEVLLFKQLLSEYGEKVPIYKTIGNMIELKDGETGGKILIPIITTQNAIYIHYLDRNRVFWSGFTGLITRVGVSHNNNSTPKITISGKTFDRILEYSYITTGLNNIGNNFRTRIQSLKDTDRAKIALNNRLSGKDASQIIVECFDVANKFFVGKEYKQNDKDYRYWKVNKLFAFGQETGQVASDGTDVRIIGTTESGIPVNDTSAWVNKSWKYDSPLYISKDFYPGSDVKLPNGTFNSTEGDWFQVKISDEFVDTDFTKVKPFQNLLRANLQLFTTDKMTIKDVLNVVRKSTFSLMYFDFDGSFKVERPYFDAVMNTGKDEIQSFGINPQSIYLRPGPPDYDLKYVISKKDKCYIDSNLDENESGLVTRVAISGKSDWYELTKEVQDLTLLGVSESSPKTISKFGDRQVQLDAITMPEFLFSTKRDEILTSYAYAMRLLLSSQRKTVTLVLDQRPDLQLNRKMIFLDYGISFLIRRLRHSFNPVGNRLQTVVEGFYVRNIGEGIFNPYFYYLSKFETGVDLTEDTFVSSKWLLNDWADTQIERLDIPNKDISKGIKTIVDDDITLYELTIDTFKKEINDVIVESPDTSVVKTYDENNINVLIMVPDILNEKPLVNRAYILYPGDSGPRKISAQATVFNKKLNINVYKKLNDLSYGSYRFTNLTDKTITSLNGNEMTYLYTQEFYYNQYEKNDTGDFELLSSNNKSTDLTVKSRKSTSNEEEQYKLILTGGNYLVLYDRFGDNDTYISKYPDTLLDGTQIVLNNNELIATILEKMKNKNCNLDVYIGRYSVKYKQEQLDTVKKIEGDEYESNPPRKFFRWCYNILAEKGKGLQTEEYTILTRINNYFKPLITSYREFPLKFDSQYKKSVKFGDTTLYGITLGTQALCGLNNSLDVWNKFKSGDTELQDTKLINWFNTLQNIISRNSNVINKIKASYFELPKNLNSIELTTKLNVLQTTGDDLKLFPFGIAVDKINGSSITTEYGLMAILFFRILQLHSQGTVGTFEDIAGKTETFKPISDLYHLIPDVPNTLTPQEMYESSTMLTSSLLPSNIVLNDKVKNLYQILTIFKMGERQF